MFSQHTRLNPVQSFQLFCLESYRSAMDISGEQALMEFKKSKVFDYLASGYEVLHTQSKHYILNELNQYIIGRHGTLPRKHSKGRTTYNS